MFANIMTGLSTVTEGFNFLLIIIGSFSGIIIGAVPGLTVVMAIALLLPVTYGMSTASAMCLLVGLFVGGMSGSGITAALLRIPGTASSMATAFDAYPMVRQGKHEAALGLVVTASFFGGCFSALVLIFLSPILASVALSFTPFEYLALVLFTFTCVGSFNTGNIFKPYLAAFLGLLLSMIGTCPMTGAPRLTLGFDEFGAGIALIPALIGMFALPQLMSDLESGILTSQKFGRISFRGQMQTIFMIFSSPASVWNFFRSAVIGTGIGILPGVGPGLSNLLSYTQAKNASKVPETFGTGNPDGIVAAEAANSSSMGGAFVPMLTLGIPGDVCTLMIMSAFMLHGLQPGPLLFRTNPNLMYTVFMAVLLGTFIVAILQMSFMNFYAKVLSIKKQYLAPVLLLCCTIGCYSLNNRMFDIWVFFAFGCFGFIIDRLKIPMLPIILGFILGPMAEQHLRGGLDISQGSLLPLVTRPVALFFMILTGICFVLPLIKQRRAKDRKSARDAA